MGKEQELREAVIDAIERQYNGSARPEYGDMINAVVAAFDTAARRSSSDEQAEVSAIGYRYRDNPDEPWSAEFWEYISPSKWADLRAQHRIFEPLYASPVKAGVTEAQVEQIAGIICADADRTSFEEGYRIFMLGKGKDHSGDCNKRPWTCMRCVYDDYFATATKITAALGVGDEGMGEADGVGNTNDGREDSQP